MDAEYDELYAGDIALKQAVMPVSNLRATVPATVALVVGLASGRSWGGNEQHPRTPVEWTDVECMERVDRSVEAVYPVAYGIPFEDTELTPEEVADSRTHQLFAICRQTPPVEVPPSWITTDDVEQTSQNYDDFVPPPDEDVLELAPQWRDCWYRINADAERRPITEEAASTPVPWDTSAVPPGVYVLWGYTYEPVFNLWAPRSGGVVRVYDGGDPAAEGPAAAISTAEQTTCVGEPVAVQGCIDALPGTTMTASFAIEGEGDWIPFATDVAVQGATFELEWTPPAQTSGASTMIRVVFTDPNGATYTAYQYAFNVVLPADAAGCGSEPDDCEVGFVADPACETGTGTGTGAASETEAESDADDAGDGCGCRAPNDAPVWAILSLLGLAARRRRSTM